jgi:hypothetical protein
MLIELHDPPTLPACCFLKVMVACKLAATLWLSQHGFGLAFDPFTTLAVESASSIVACLV